MLAGAPVREAKVFEVFGARTWGGKLANEGNEARHFLPCGEVALQRSRLGAVRHSRAAFHRLHISIQSGTGVPHSTTLSRLRYPVCAGASNSDVSCAGARVGALVPALALTASASTAVQRMSL